MVVTGALTSEELTSARLIAIAICHGLAIAFLVMATAHISGGHLNPAVTLGIMLSRNIRPVRGLMYIIAQLIGAVGGAFLLCLILPTEGSLGSHALGEGISVQAGVLMEATLTFILVFVVFATAIDRRGLGQIAPLAIGFAVLVDHLVGVPLTGASMNPARSFGPALVSGEWVNHWVYWVGPLAGGLVAASIYRWVFMPRNADQATN